MPRDENDDRNARVRRWRSGTALHDAWYKFGDARQKKLHDENRGTSASLAYRLNLAANLFQDLADGSLRAMGYRLQPNLSDGPLDIPSDTFEQQLPDDWDSGTVGVSGWVYDRIRVVPSEEERQAREPEPQAEPKKEEGDAEIRKGPGGRINTYPWSKTALDALFAEHPEYIDLSASELWPFFKQKYDVVHQKILKQRPAVGERKLRDQLKLYKAERTGTNRNK